MSKFQLSTICRSGDIVIQSFDVFGHESLLAAILNLHFS